MGSKVPCRGNEGWVYKRGKKCFQCDKCPGGHGRNRSEEVLNATRINKDMGCLGCEPCPTNQYNNGGWKSCVECFQNCAERNRQNCSSKATQPCGECFDGFFEVYQVPDNPSTCTPCTEKDIGLIPECLNFTTSTRAATTWKIDDHNFAKNISETDIKDAVDIRYGYSADETNTRMDLITGLSSMCSVAAILFIACVIYKCYKKRREKSKRNDQKSRMPQQAASACPLLVNSSVESQINGVGSDVKVYTKETYCATEQNPETVPTAMDPVTWKHRSELLRSNNTICRTCAQQWTELGTEYQVLSISLSTVKQLEKEKEDKLWTNAEFCYQIIKRWTEIKGEQATVKALCDALFAKGHYEIIDKILLSGI